MAILKKGNILGICVHHSAVSPGAKNLVELKQRAIAYDRSHASKSWAAQIKTPGEFGYQYIEYHYLIAKDGSLLQVQDEKYVLYHSGDNFRNDLSFNLHGIAVMLDGNYETERPTEAQMKTLVRLIRETESKYKINARIRGHKETSKTATACPGRYIGKHDSGWLQKVIANVNDKNYSTEPEEPQPDCEKYITAIESLKKENTNLKTALGASEDLVENRDAELKMAKERVEYLEQVLKDREESENEALAQLEVCRTERNRIEQDRLKIQQELDELKQGRDNWLNRLADMLHKLFGGNK